MSFDLRKYLAEGRLFKEDLPKKQWAYLNDEEKDEYAKEIFDLIDNAYQSIGGHPNYISPSSVSNDERDANYLVIDLDDDPEIDAVKVSKTKPAGNKSVGMGHDGSKEAKSSAINLTAAMLTQPGNYIEVSGKLLDILQAKGVSLVTDEETIRKALDGKEIEMNADGSYSRVIGGERHTKVLMGFPKV